MSSEKKMLKISKIRNYRNIKTTLFLRVFFVFFGIVTIATGDIFHKQNVYCMDAYRVVQILYLPNSVFKILKKKSLKTMSIILNGFHVNMIKLFVSSSTFIKWEMAIYQMLFDVFFIAYISG